MYLSVITCILDKISSRLEGIGFLKEAFRLDIISNTLDSFSGPTVGINKFVERHLDSNFSGTKVTSGQLDKILKEVRGKVLSKQWKPGYADYVKIVTIKDPSIKSSIAKITSENECKLKTRKTKRRDFEEEYSERYFESKDVHPVPSDHVDIILYSREQLLSEPGGNPSGSDWDIISINAEPTSGGTPMSSDTIRRNMRGKEYGGSGHLHSDQELSESEAFWSSHAKIL